MRSGTTVAVVLRLIKALERNCIVGIVCVCMAGCGYTWMVFMKCTVAQANKH